jgi:hypothetical protein
VAGFVAVAAAVEVLAFFDSFFFNLLQHFGCKWMII